MQFLPLRATACEARSSRRPCGTSLGGLRTCTAGSSGRSQRC
jgi:hypothetical protein